MPTNMAPNSSHQPIQFLHVVRAMYGLSQRDLAQRSGLSTWRIWCFENGVSRPSSDEVMRLWGVLSTENG